MIARYIARQFSRPSGLLGRVIGRGMARHNEREARWTVDLLGIEPEARVLEIGFGPGVAIQYAADRTTRGHVSGIDCSEAMLQMARKRNASRLANGLVDLASSHCLIRMIRLIAHSPFTASTFGGTPRRACAKSDACCGRTASSQLRFARYINGKGANRRLTCFTFTAGMRLRSCSPILASGVRALNPTHNLRSLVSAFSL